MRVNNNIESTIISEVLLFIKGNDGKVSRYYFDQYVTINVKIEESFNVVLRYLLDKGLIYIRKEDLGTFIELSEKGNNYIDSFYKTVSSEYEFIEEKFFWVKNLSVIKSMPFLKMYNERLHIKVKIQNDNEQMIYLLWCSYPKDNQIISKTKIFDMNREGLSLVANLIEFYFNLYKPL